MKFKKTLLFVASLVMFGTIAGPSVTANAKKIVGMPRSFRHVWYRGHERMKITKYHVYWGSRSRWYKYSRVTFKYVFLTGHRALPDIPNGVGVEPYTLSHGHMYYGLPQSKGGDGTFYRYHR
ncbi:hypothetical protein [Lentilactobacillus sunkii]|uniref:hypothetical protein n=1 Tax=Lentilactobacillus sunkii TaxID=481719 RepID=UPI000710F4C3|nr:hypothetical protein [Lentilactobacillus sunkii]